jgi:uncharacterized phiE125 gp8 family phage protein
MSLYLIEAPSQDDVLSVDEAKRYLRVDLDDDDELIEGLIAAAIQNIDGRDGWLGRALAAQTWELRQHDFGGQSIKIPLPPLIAVESVKYYDAEDALQTLPTDHYEIVGAGGYGKATIMLKDGKSWPALGRRAENVLVRFRAGYVTNESPQVGNVPAPIVTAIKRQVGAMYEHREAVIVNSTASKLPGGVEALLLPLRVW